MSRGQFFTRPVPHGRSRYGFWLVPENFCVFLPNQRVACQGVESALLPVLENYRRPVFSRPEVGKFNVFFWKLRCRRVWSKLGEGLQNETVNSTWEWSLKICTANTSLEISCSPTSYNGVLKEVDVYTLVGSLLVKSLNQNVREYTKFIHWNWEGEIRILMEERPSRG